MEDAAGRGLFQNRKSCVEDVVVDARVQRAGEAVGDVD
jgi:hypothetical protein